MSEFKELMKSCGMSTQGLTDKLPDSIHTVRHWVTGNRAPDPVAVEKLTRLSKEIKNIFGEKQ